MANDVASKIGSLEIPDKQLPWLEASLRGTLHAIIDVTERRPVPLSADRMKQTITAAMAYGENTEKKQGLFFTAGQISHLLGGFIRPHEVYEFLMGPDGESFTECRRYWPDDSERWQLRDLARSGFGAKLTDPEIKA